MRIPEVCFGGAVTMYDAIDVDDPSSMWRHPPGKTRETIAANIIRSRDVWLTTTGEEKTKKRKSETACVTLMP